MTYTHHRHLQRLRLRLYAVDLERLLNDLEHVLLHDTGWTCNDTHEDAECLVSLVLPLVARTSAYHTKPTCSGDTASLCSTFCTACRFEASARKAAQQDSIWSTD